MKKLNKQQILKTISDNAIPIMVGSCVVTFVSVAVVNKNYAKLNHEAYVAFLQDKNRLLADGLETTVNILIEELQKK